MSDPKRYAIVGTGARSAMFIDVLTTTYRDVSEIVGFCDLSQTRMNWYNRKLQKEMGMEPRPTYPADQFDRMIAETKPDVVIVTTMDATHHLYITRAMELGCDVITEKPMTTDAEKTRAIFDTIERTGRSLRVTFNYRYAPAYTRVREVVMNGTIGKPLSVDFSWLLDTRHGADYFRRWHREKQNSGGLIVHKATHHFDLVNWWIDSYPQEIFAFGKLSFYGCENARARGENYTYSRYTGVSEAQNDPFALFLDENEEMRGLYLDAEPESGYIRDRNVFGEPITIEDTMTITGRYQNGVLLSYCLLAYSPWEGLRLAITGTKGRVELDVVESINHIFGDGRPDNGSQETDENGQLKASKGAFKKVSLRVFPMFQPGYDVEIPATAGGHGGADPVMLEQIFSPNPPSDPFNRAASHIDGAASILTGIAANESMRTGKPVKIMDLFPLPEKQKA
ncbi:MAG TPA: Gfo/Idh/MocA family oxidoreductase [Aggregatilineales bacterium]|nr:Gfo/Idh/MocA family oxidoreductase [Aggregatilineales bacterium]